MLDEAAKQGLCRLIICGRGRLLKVVSDRDFWLAKRVELIRPPPLGEKTAREMLLTPLGDLGFEVQDVDAVAERVLRLTGCLPHMIQFLGGRIAHRCVDHGTRTISTQTVDQVMSDFEAAEFFTAPLRGLDDESSRSLALLLLKEMKDELSLEGICNLADRYGLRLDSRNAFDVCTDLLINNVLAWNAGTFRVANEALVQFAFELGFVQGALGNVPGAAAPVASKSVGAKR
jgi:hypothetical protein